MCRAGRKTLLTHSLTRDVRIADRSAVEWNPQNIVDLQMDCGSFMDEKLQMRILILDT